MSDEQNASPSPLTEASPDSLNELFASLDEHINNRTLESAGAKKDIEGVVNALRSERERWLAAEQSGAKKLSKPMKAGETTLGDLGLE